MTFQEIINAIKALSANGESATIEKLTKNTIMVRFNSYFDCYDYYDERITYMTENKYFDTEMAEDLLETLINTAISYNRSYNGCVYTFTFNGFTVVVDYENYAEL